MQIFNSTYYILIFILCKLFFQNQALEDNARSEDKDSPSLALIQNDESLRNFVKRDAINSPITEIKETENIEKRGTKKSKKSKRKVVKKKKSKKSIKKKPSKNKTKKPLKKKTKKSKSKKNKIKSSTKKKPPSKKPKKTAKKRRTTKRRRTTKSTTTTSTTTTFTTTTTTSTTTTTKPDEFSKLKSLLYLTIDNLRTEYRAKKLKVNETLAELAQNFTDRFVNQSLTNLEVELKNIELTKNISIGAVFYYVKASEEYKPLSKWTLGAPFIDYRYPERFPSGGDFTLLIWSSSTHVGCGISKNSLQSTIATICLIYPKGNIKGQFAENIHPSIWKTDHPRLIIKKSR
uniref:SCP domain-containing protein n=1 Tax=Strongyloides venezuelensis TaxID=75913 RepID=A0A0K0FJ97_STRVS